MLEIIKQFVRRMLMGKGKGILQIAPKKDVDKFAKELLKKFKENGIPDSAVKNPNDVKVIWNQITNRESQILSTTLDDLFKKPHVSEGLKGTRVWDLSKKKGEVIPFKYKKTLKKEIEEMIPQEVIPKETPMTKDDFFRIKQGLSTKIKLNTLGENKQFAKELIHNKNAEFNSLDRKSVV